MGPETAETIEGNHIGRVVYTLQAAFERGTFAKDIVIKKRIRVIRIPAPGMDFQLSQVRYPVFSIYQIIIYVYCKTLSNKTSLLRMSGLERLIMNF